MEYRIGLIHGDGIGPEIVDEAKKVLDAVCEKYGHKFEYTNLLLGGASIDVHGVPLTDETIEEAKKCDAVLMGSIGGDAKTSPWYKLSPDKRPEAGLLKIRKSLGLFANLRPAYLYQELKDACPLKEEIIGEGFDMLIMRELTGGLYFGERSTVEENGIKKATDTLTYSEPEIRRIAIRAFDIARKRKKKVTSVDKANVLDSSRLWRAVVEDVAKDYPDEHSGGLLLPDHIQKSASILAANLYFKALCLQSSFAGIAEFARIIGDQHIVVVLHVNTPPKML